MKLFLILALCVSSISMADAAKKEKKKSKAQVECGEVLSEFDFCGDPSPTGTCDPGYEIPAGTRYLTEMFESRKRATKKECEDDFTKVTTETVCCNNFGN